MALANLRLISTSEGNIFIAFFKFIELANMVLHKIYFQASVC